MIDLRKETRFNCATSQGELQKKWCIDKNGRRYMIKGNYGQSYQQSLNEVFATRLHEQQRFTHYTRYSLVQVQTDGNIEGIGCMCYDFCSENIECISAWELLQTVKVRQNESYYYPLKNVCLELGMDERGFYTFSRLSDYDRLSYKQYGQTYEQHCNYEGSGHTATVGVLLRSMIRVIRLFYNTPYEKLSLYKTGRDQDSFVCRAGKTGCFNMYGDRLLVDIDKAEMDFSIYEMDVVERQIRIPLFKKAVLQENRKLKIFPKRKGFVEKVLKGEINYDEKEACIFPAGPDGGTEEEKEPEISC